MKYITSFYILILVFSIGILCASCEKFLDVVTDKSITSPTSLDDLESFLWNFSDLNNSTSGLLELGTDDYYLNETAFASQEVFLQNVYLWNSDIDFTVSMTNIHWTAPYRAVLLANTILDKLPTVREADEQRAAQIEGEAFFIRSWVFFHLAQIYAPVYRRNTINDESGILLKLSSDINENVNRATVEETYRRIIDDLNKAKEVLPKEIIYKTRASRPAAEALLAKIHLVMGNYDEAERAAANALAYYNTLIDYNDVNHEVAIPFRGDINDEIIFFAFSGSPTLIRSTLSKIDTLLYKQYADNDRRKYVFFTEEANGEALFKGWYSGQNACSFSGLHTAELYLILAECQARRGDKGSALSNMEILLKHRYDGGRIDFLYDLEENNLLPFVLNERRKELLFRGTRWSDLRRLNLEDDFRTTLKRTVKMGDIYKSVELEPNSARYVYPLPATVVEYGGVNQNIR